MSKRSIRNRLNRVLSHQNEKSDETKTRRGHQPENLQELATLARAAIRMVARSQRINYAKEESEKAEHSRNETSMTASTAVIARFTRVLVAVGILSAYVSYKQWGEMIAGGDDTHALAKAAEEQAKASQKQVMTISAHLRFGGVLFQPQYTNSTPPIKPELTGWVLNPTWTNVGGTDALDVKTWWNYMIVDVPPGTTYETLEENDCPPFNIYIDKARPTVISPGGTNLQGGGFLPLQAAIRASSQSLQAAIYVVGRIEYRDIFPDSKIHFAEWCKLEIPNDIDKGKFSPVDILFKTD